MFFTGWKLWERLVFILACAIVTVILLGCCKLAYTHQRLRKFAAIADTERQKQALQRKISEARRPPGTKKEGEVPFGVRAIESGVQIEGVWLSPTSTPDLTTPTGSLSSFQNELENYTARQSQDFPGLGGSPEAHERRRSAAESKDDEYERLKSYSGEPKCLGSGSAAPSSQPRFPLFQSVRYANPPYMSQRSPMATTLEGLEAIHRASTSYHDPDSGYGNSDSSDSSQQSGRCSDGRDRSLDVLATGAMVRSGRQYISVDMNLIESHRAFQAAETGQLTPRVKRRMIIDDGSGLLPNPSLYSAGEDCFGQSHDSSLQAAPFIEVGSSFTGIRSSNTPDVVPFAQFARPLPQPDRPMSIVSRSTDSTAGRTDEGDVTASVAYNSQLTQQEKSSRDERSLPGEMGVSFDKLHRVQSDVLRGHGTGFEILRPGSLRTQRPDESSPERRGASMPPVSLQSFMRSRSSSRSTSSHRGRKLQKKRSSSTGSSKTQ